MEKLKLFLHQDNELKLETTRNIPDYDTLAEVAKKAAFDFKMDQLEEVFADDLEEEFDYTNLSACQNGPSHRVGPATVIQVQVVYKVVYKDLDVRRRWTYNITATFITV